MSIKYHCDKCRLEVDLRSDYTNILIKKRIAGYNPLPEDLHFCENCAKLLAQFLKSEEDKSNG